LRSSPVKLTVANATRSLPPPATSRCSPPISRCSRISPPSISLSPKNTEVPFYTENAPDSFGFVANPAGPSFTDQGVGAILATSTNPQWVQLAPQFIGTFQVATLRNVAKRPRSSFIKGYMHNGYFKTLEQVVHFYNTRDVFAVCPADLGTAIGGEVGNTCWPAPEVPNNENKTQIGNLGLSHDQELAIVAFLRTLTDGYTPLQNPVP
jgi:cytochrome c peroxidase